MQDENSFNPTLINDILDKFGYDAVNYDNRLTTSKYNNIDNKYKMILNRIILYDKIRELKEREREDQEKEKSFYNLILENGKYTKKLLKIKFTKIACSGTHLAGITVKKKLYTWGLNSFGKLGLGSDSDHIKNPMLIKDINNCTNVGCGYAYTCVASGSNLYSAGAGENGRLGIGSDNNSSVFKISKWENVNEILQIVGGSVHTLILVSPGKLYSCGHKFYNGHNNKKDTLIPKLLNAFQDIMIDSVSIGHGGYHSLVLDKSGKVYSWGHNRVGQLGLGYNIDIDDNRKGTHAVTKPQLVKSLLNYNVRKVVSGWGHSLVLLWDGTILSCGRNSNGQTGHKTEDSQTNGSGYLYLSTFKKIKFFNSFNIVDIFSTGCSSYALNYKNELYAWGEIIDKDDINEKCHPEIKLTEKINLISLENNENIGDFMVTY